MRCGVKWNRRQALLLAGAYYIALHQQMLLPGEETPLCFFTKKDGFKYSMEMSISSGRSHHGTPEIWL